MGGPQPDAVLAIKALIAEAVAIKALIAGVLEVIGRPAT